MHGIWHTAGLIFLCVGLVAVFKSHNSSVSTGGDPYANLTSLHSWIGICTVVLFCQNYLMGILHFVLPYLSVDLRKLYMPFHVFLGRTAFIIACCAALTGIMEKNTFKGCGYSVTKPDYNPAEHYNDIQNGCKVSNGIGMLIVVLVLCCLYSLEKLNVQQQTHGHLKLKGDDESDPFYT